MTTPTATAPRSSTTSPHPKRSTERVRAYRRTIESALSSQSLSADALDKLLDIDAEMFQWRRRLQKHEFARQALLELKLDLEHAQLEALIVIAHITYGYGELAPRSATVGAIAEEMVIDPSRASRLASDLVAKRYVRRTAVQEDGRKSCLVLTPDGDEVLSAVVAYKWRRVAAVFRGWSDQELSQFAQLLGKFNRDQAQAMADLGQAEAE